MKKFIKTYLKGVLFTAIIAGICAVLDYFGINIKNPYVRVGADVPLNRETGDVQSASYAAVEALEKAADNMALDTERCRIAEKISSVASDADEATKVRAVKALSHVMDLMAMDSGRRCISDIIEELV